MFSGKTTTRSPFLVNLLHVLAFFTGVYELLEIFPLLSVFTAVAISSAFVFTAWRLADRIGLWDDLQSVPFQFNVRTLILAQTIAAVAVIVLKVSNVDVLFSIVFSSTIVLGLWYFVDLTGVCGALICWLIDGAADAFTRVRRRVPRSDRR